jgi:hypothetical protein
MTVRLTVHRDRDSFKAFAPRCRALDRTEGCLERLTGPAAEGPEARARSVRVAVGHLGQVDALQHRDPSAQGHLAASRLSDVIPALHSVPTDPVHPRKFGNVDAGDSLLERNRRGGPTKPERCERVMAMHGLSGG